MIGRMLIIIMTIVAGILVGTNWVMRGDITLGEACIGAVSTIILILVMAIWIEMGVKRKK